MGGGKSGKSDAGARRTAEGGTWAGQARILGGGGAGGGGVSIYIFL